MLQSQDVSRSEYTHTAHFHFLQSVQIWHFPSSLHLLYWRWRQYAPKMLLMNYYIIWHNKTACINVMYHQQQAQC